MKANNKTSSMYANETWSTDRIKALTLNKIYSTAVVADNNKSSRVTRKFAMLTAVTILMLSLATVALAASGIINISSTINSIFNNKDAAPYIQSGDGIIMHSNDGDVSIKPIAAFYEVARSGIYLELEITDPSDTRLSDLMIFIDMDSGNNGNVVTTGPVDVRLIDDNTVIAGLLVSPVNVGVTTVRFDTIVSGVEWVEEAQFTEFKIGEHIGIDRPAVVSGAEFIEISEISLDSGRLTIAYRNSDVSVYGWGSATLGLVLPDGETIWSNSGAVGVGVPGQQDFFEIGNTDPNDLTLVWRGIRAVNTITGNWEFTVTGENIINPLILNGVFEGNDIEIVIGATVVDIKVFADYYNTDFPYDIHAENRVTLMLKDGTTVQTKVSGVMYDDTIASFVYYMNFVDPADVVSVTFYGVTMKN